MYKPPRDFTPPRWLSNAHTQTILTHFLPTGSPLIKSRSHVIPLPDGDQILTTESKPLDWKEGGRIMLMAHGLAGCETSSYMIRIGHQLYNSGYNVFRINHRGCGPGAGLARNPYHCGRSEDILEVLRSIYESYPNSPVTYIGFSLSANIGLKLSGELGLNNQKNLYFGLDSCIATSPPIDLNLSAKKMQRTSARIYNLYFIRRLKKHLKQASQNFADYNAPSIRWMSYLKDFDEMFTAPRSGFDSAEHYYQVCSSQNFIPSIQIPTLILASIDDPVVEISPLRQLKIPSCVDTVMTRRGGHVGFYDNNGFWMDEVIGDWIDRRLPSALT
jgi:predicted alpha/beta-fold hydrolase